MTAIAETDIGRPVVEYLKADGWDVHQEVPFGGKAADIVALRDGLIHVIEVKKTVGFAVLDQAIHWTAWADFVSVAGPRPKSYRGQAFRTVVDRWGIGVLDVDISTFGASVNRDLPPRLHRRANRVAGATGRKWLLDACTDDTRTSIAGSRSGGVMTPFKKTCRAVVAIVRLRGPISTKDLVSALTEHHYSSDASARSSLVSWAGKGPLSEVELVGTYRPVWQLKAAPIGGTD